MPSVAWIRYKGYEVGQGVGMGRGPDGHDGLGRQREGQQEVPWSRGAAKGTRAFERICEEALVRAGQVGSSDDAAADSVCIPHPPPPIPPACQWPNLGPPSLLPPPLTASGCGPRCCTITAPTSWGSRGPSLLTSGSTPSCRTPGTADGGGRRVMGGGGRRGRGEEEGGMLTHGSLCHYHHPPPFPLSPPPLSLQVPPRVPKGADAGGNAR